jgi:hypothetical protein
MYIRLCMSNMNQSCAGELDQAGIRVPYSFKIVNGKQTYTVTSVPNVALVRVLEQQSVGSMMLWGASRKASVQMRLFLCLVVSITQVTLKNTVNYYAKCHRHSQSHISRKGRCALHEGLLAEVLEVVLLSLLSLLPFIALHRHILLSIEINILHCLETEPEQHHSVVACL